MSLIAAIPGVAELAMTTNGTLLAAVAADLAARGLQSVNVSIDSVEDARYAELTQAAASATRRRSRAARDAGLRVKVNAVALEGREADLEGVAAWAAREGTPSIDRPLQAGRGKRDGGAYDRPPRCSGCDRLRLLADGTLRPCLHGSEGIPVDFGDLEGSIEARRHGQAAARLPQRRLHAGADRRMKMSESLSHVDEAGAARMVDVSSKPRSRRTATAAGRIDLAPATLLLSCGKRPAEGRRPRGRAHLAGIMAAKKAEPAHTAVPQHRELQHVVEPRARRALGSP